MVQVYVQVDVQVYVKCTHVQVYVQVDVQVYVRSKCTVRTHVPAVNVA
jgi:hypothetical protein